MADRFDKFTEHARRVLTLAQEESQRFNHNYIGTEHLLLGLIRERDALATTLLTGMDVDLNVLRSSVEAGIVREERAALGEIGLTPRGKRAIELAVDEARRYNHHYVGTEHLLIGLVREGDGIAGAVLANFGVDLERLRAETDRVLAESGPEEIAVSLSRVWSQGRQMTVSFYPALPLTEDDGPPSLQLARMALEAIRSEKDAALDAQLFEKAAQARQREIQLAALVRRMEDAWRVGDPHDE
jgi:hypothetical protein